MGNGNAPTLQSMCFCEENCRQTYTDWTAVSPETTETGVADLFYTVLFNGIKAVYKRLNVNLNRGAGGKYIYICCTRDPRFNPLTKLDAIVEGKNVVREPYWSGVRAVRDSDVSTDRYSDVNAGTGSRVIHIMQTKHEIL